MSSHFPQSRRLFRHVVKKGTGPEGPWRGGEINGITVGEIADRCYPHAWGWTCRGAHACGPGPGLGSGDGGAGLAGHRTFSGNATGDKVGSSKYSVSVTATPSSTLIEDNGSGGECAIASGSGTVTAADMSVVGFNTVGLLCQEGAASSTAVHYNGTYRITPVNSSGAASSGRFAAAVGGGSLVGTLTIPSTGIGVSFVKIDGTINF